MPPPYTPCPPVQAVPTLPDLSLLGRFPILTYHTPHPHLLPSHRWVQAAVERGRMGNDMTIHWENYSKWSVMKGDKTLFIETLLMVTSNSLPFPCICPHPAYLSRPTGRPDGRTAGRPDGGRFGKLIIHPSTPNPIDHSIQEGREGGRRQEGLPRFGIHSSWAGGRRKETAGLFLPQTGSLLNPPYLPKQ